MRIYQVYSKVLECDVKLTYNDNGVLVVWECIDREVLKKNADVHIKLFVTEDAFKSAITQFNLKVIQIDRVVTFDMFWDRYDYKMSGKHKALEAWNKLSKAEQIEAYDFIPAYFAHLKLNNIAKKYAVTYLNQKPWEK